MYKIKLRIQEGFIFTINFLFPVYIKCLIVNASLRGQQIIKKTAINLKK